MMMTKASQMCMNCLTSSVKKTKLRYIQSRSSSSIWRWSLCGPVRDLCHRKVPDLCPTSPHAIHSKSIYICHNLRCCQVTINYGTYTGNCVSFINQHRKYCTQRRGRHVYSMVPSSLRYRPPWRVLFFGTDDFSLETLKTLNENRLYPDTKRLVDTLDVVAMKKEVPVRLYARNQGLRILDWPPKVSPFDYDVGVLVSFGHLIPEKIIHMFPYGILNVHPSLLPRWRGAAPIVYTILNGDRETGISIMEIRPKHFDIGPILLQKTYTVPDNFTSFQLKDMMAPLGAHVSYRELGVFHYSNSVLQPADLMASINTSTSASVKLLEALSDLPALERFEVEQGTIGVTYAHKLTKSMAYIDWQRQTCEDIDRQYRAMHQIIPLKSTFGGKPVQLLGMGDIQSVNDDVIERYVLSKYKRPTKDIPPGFPLYSKVKDLLLIKSKDGWVGFKEIVFQRRLPANQFSNGHLSRPIYANTVFQSVNNYINNDIYSEKAIAHEG